jgi:hypothetical protein
MSCSPVIGVSEGPLSLAIDSTCPPVHQYGNQWSFRTVCMHFDAGALCFGSHRKKHFFDACQVNRFQFGVGTFVNIGQISVFFNSYTASKSLALISGERKIRFSMPVSGAAPLFLYPCKKRLVHRFPRFCLWC